jgi:pyruvate/2-oxoacid:ferredoxin oxidoreductase alpha subunit
MAKSLLFVESNPDAADRLEEYHRWHDRVHVPEMLAIDGFVSARRWKTDGETFVTLYEIDADIDTARTNLRAALDAGRMSKPVAVQTNPPPVMRYMSLVSELP